MSRPLTRGRTYLAMLASLLVAGVGLAGEADPPPSRWVPLGEKRERPRELDGREDLFRVIDSRAERLTLSLDLTGMELTASEAPDGRTYTAVRAAGAGLAWEGGPDLPVFGRWILVPNGATPVLEVDPGGAVVLEHVLVAPLQPLWPDVEGGPPPPGFSRDEAVYGADRMYPSELARLESVTRLAGQSCTILWLQPFRHNPVRRTLEVYPDLRVTVRFEGGVGTLPPLFDESPFATILGRLAVNAEAVLAAERVVSAERAEASEVEAGSGRAFNGYDHLIVAHQKFQTAAYELAKWRKKCGQDVFVALCNWPASTIYGLIYQLYDNFPGKLKYVTFIGDAEYVPTRYQTWHTWNTISGTPSQGYIGTDMHYATYLEFPGSGFESMPQLSLGRIAADESWEALEMVGRIIDSEKNPTMDSSFYDNATLCAYFQDGIEGYTNPDKEADRRFAQTTEDLAIFLSSATYGVNKTVNRIYYAKGDVDPETWCSGTIGGQPNFSGLAGSPGGNIPTYLEKPGFAWDGDSADINSAITAGTFLLTHRDHGGRKEWSDPEYLWWELYHLHVPASKSPMVWSVNCQTGWFDNETDFKTKKGITDQTASWEESFVEDWLNSTQTGGPVGVLGATRVSESYYNDRLMWGLTDAIWPWFLSYNPSGTSAAVRRMGDALNYAKAYLATTVADTAWRTAHFELYHWFGDPSWWVRVDVPLQIIAELPTLWEWMLFPNTWSITVTWASGPSVGEAVDGATVTITKDDSEAEFWKGTTDESGQVVFDQLQTMTAGEYEVVVTAPDSVPYITTFVSQPSSTGGVAFDAEVFACSATVGIRVADSDLSESAQVVVSSAGGDEEWVVLAETGADTGVFEGVLESAAGAAVPDSGFLELSHGEEITVEYQDLDNGYGGSGWVVDTASTDCEPPAFDGLQHAESGENLVMLHWSPASDDNGPVTYRVYRAEEPMGRQPQLVGTTPAPSYPDLDVRPNLLFTYLVRAVDAVGNEDSNLVSMSVGSPLLGVGVGEGSVGWAMPLATEWRQARLQTIYPAELIGRPCRIHTVALEVSAIPDQELVNWTIRMRHTLLTSYEEPLWEGDGWETVYSQGEVISETGLHTFVLTVPFDFSGVDNLMVDFSFDSPVTGVSGEVLTTDAGEPRSLVRVADGSEEPPLEWVGLEPAGTLEPLFPNLHLGVTELPVFIEDFESGDLTLWSAVTGDPSASVPGQTIQTILR